jgi:hypothetical protein
MNHNTNKHRTLDLILALIIGWYGAEILFHTFTGKPGEGLVLVLICVYLTATRGK